MIPKYSVLFCNQVLQEHIDEIREWLKTGIKVFWFGQQEEAQQLKAEFAPFVAAFFLQCYETKNADKTIIIDGSNSEKIIEKLEKTNPEFNAAQYMVEHCKADEHIIVEASAGTGKTTVMIDRIMYLLHTEANLEPSEIYMITFTNDATNQMNSRLQTMLLTKYQLTGNIKYLGWLEKQSQMNISTIHSFAYTLLRTYGVSAGFSKELTIRTFNYERKELIKDDLNDIINQNSSVRDQIGMSFYKGNSTINAYWKRLAQLGLLKKDIMNMDWGRGVDKPSTKFQEAILSVLDKLDDDYLTVKQRNNAISLEDILRDLEEVLSHIEDIDESLKIKYLFVDEFQDSDNSQIKVLCWLVEHIKLKLFVVGDIKQSIYRFRGANDTAFSTLEDELKHIKENPPHILTLINNYRTSDNVLNKMNAYFKNWAEKGILEYKKPVIAFNKEEGKIKMYSSDGKYNMDAQFCNVVKQAIDNRNTRLIKKGNESKESDKVAILCRTNRQLNEIGKICSSNHIPAIVKREGSFYISEAVRDFYAMIASFVFPDEPEYLFNYLVGPYADIEDSMSILDMEKADGDRTKLIEYLSKFLNRTKWNQYSKEFRLSPVMSVIKKMMDEASVLDSHIGKVKRRQMDRDWDEIRSDQNALADARQYKANLDKLMEILQRNNGNEFTSLFDIYGFLKLSIETNRDEQEADVNDKEDINCLYCMTVHKAKGMEFDTVIIPYTDTPFYYDSTTEILVSNDKSKIGWQYIDRNQGLTLSNSYYSSVRGEEEMSATQEETRILYVAMTRTKHTLICLVAPGKSANTWAHLIREVGVDDE